MNFQNMFKLWNLDGVDEHPVFKELGILYTNQSPYVVFEWLSNKFIKHNDDCINDKNKHEFFLTKEQIESRNPPSVIDTLMQFDPKTVIFEFEIGCINLLFNYDEFNSLYSLLYKLKENGKNKNVDLILNVIQSIKDKKLIDFFENLRTFSNSDFCERAVALEDQKSENFYIVMRSKDLVSIIDFYKIYLNSKGASLEL